jgi:uncharacterized membrane protein YsdA (DUF1294 family)
MYNPGMVRCFFTSGILPRGTKPPNRRHHRVTVGNDSHGRRCATQATHRNDGGRLRMIHVVLVILLLVAPTMAAWRIGGVNLLAYVAGAYGVASALTYFLYASDKQRARRTEWRIQESTLHLFEFMGGWPGAFLAQRRLRHKCSKVSFQLAFWLIVALHQYVAVDSLMDWRMSETAFHEMRKWFRLGAPFIGNCPPRSSIG